MVDNEKRDNLVNARRKLKKFRDEQQPNGTDIQSLNETSSKSSIVNNIELNATGFVNEQKTILSGIYQNSSKSPVTQMEEYNRQCELLIEKEKEQRIRLEDQRQSNNGSSLSNRSSQSQPDVDSTRKFEEKSGRDVKHLQEQLEIHVQTIGMLVADKSDISAKLSQSFKQLERKKSEMDEFHGRLKASRERVQELEQQIKNSTGNVQKREMATKELNKENDRLKIENIRQSQLIEDLKQNLNELNQKLDHRQNLLQQSNQQIEQLQKQSEHHLQQSQFNDHNSTVEIYEQHIQQLQQTITNKNKQIQQLDSSLEEMRSENVEQQQSIQQLNGQINQFIQNELINKTSQIKFFPTESNENVVDQHDRLQEENQFDQQSDLFLKENHSVSRHSPSNSLSIQFNHDNNCEHDLIERLNRVTHENINLKDRIEQLEHLVLQLQSETETIGDYIYLYQQQRQQLQERFQQKDELIKQLNDDRFNLQTKLSELEIFVMDSLNIRLTQSNGSISTIQQQFDIDHNDSKSVSNSSLFPQLDDKSKGHLLALIKEFGQNHLSSSQSDNIFTTKLAFVDQNVHKCSTCTGPVQWV